MELDHEKFKGAQELAEISTGIAQGLATLQTIKDETDEYLVERERQLIQRLKSALVDSSDLIASIGENHSALVGYNTEIKDFHKAVLSLLQGVMELNTRVSDAATDLEGRMSEHDVQVRNFQTAVTHERIQIAGDRNQVAADQQKLDEDRRLLKDRQDMFDRTLARTKK